MKENAKNRTKLTVLVSVLLLVVLMSSTVAWLMTSSETRRIDSFSLSGFQATPNLYFQQGNGTKTEVAPVDGKVAVSLNPGDGNYIGKLHLDVQYKGKGEAMLRVKLAHQWMNADGTVAMAPVNVPYRVRNDLQYNGTGNQFAWFDNRNVDFCYYMATPIYGNKNIDTYTIPVIEGVYEDELAYDTSDGMQLTVAVEVQAVQVNRYPQYWEIDNLPWPAADSAKGMNLATVIAKD